MSDEIKSVIDNLNSTFEDFKSENSKRLDEIEKKGSADPILEEKVDKMADDISKMAETKQAIELQAKNLAEAQAKLDNLETVIGRPNTGETKDVDIQMKAFGDWLRKGEVDEMEKKALYESDDTLGGFYAPAEYVADLIKGVTEISPIRSIARVRSTSNRGIEIPKRTGQFAAQFVAETGTRSETTGYTTGLMQIDAHELYALVDISQAMLEDSAFDLESEMSEEFGTQFAKAEGNAMIVGDAVGKPEGIITNSSIGTTNSGASAALTGDGLIDLVHAVKSPYGTNGTFIFNRTTLAAIRSLKDTAGQYVFQAGMMLTAGVPNTILGYPYVEMPDMADVGAGSKSVAFGDFSRGYMVVDRVALSVLRDPFTQATSGNVRYVARRRVGGQVVLPEALRIQVTSA